MEEANTMGGDPTRDPAFSRSPFFQPPHWLASLGEVRLRCSLGGSYVRGTSLDSEIAKDIAAALKGPLAAFRGVDPAKMRKGQVLNDYITAMVPALLLIVAEQRRQHDELPKKKKPPKGRTSKASTKTKRPPKEN